MVFIKYLKDSLLKLYNKLFPIWERLGFHITRNLYYEPIPDTRTLKKELWEKESDLVGIDINVELQKKILNNFSLKYKNEYEKIPMEQTLIPFKYYYATSFGAVDAEILYCMIRNFKPKKIIEIGSGYSTFLMAQAILKNKEEESFNCDLISIDPYPNKVVQKGFPGLSQLIPKKVEEVPLKFFNNLNENDILFIDSSHILRIGGDVQFEFLEILPRLNKGVIVHIHDIFLPKEYPMSLVLKSHRFYSEQYILQAFLTYNDIFVILWAGSFMHLKYPELLKKAFNSYSILNPLPGSFWIKRIK